MTKLKKHGFTESRGNERVENIDVVFSEGGSVTLDSGEHAVAISRTEILYWYLQYGDI